MGRHKVEKYGWYHDWSLHTDVSILWLSEELANADDLHGPFKLFKEAKADALSKAKWEKEIALHQMKQIRALKK